MDASITLFDWQEGGLAAVDGREVAETALLAADSFLVDDGAVLAVGLHHSRFGQTAREQGFADRAGLDAFWATALEAIPRTGRWFPRFELVTVREAPRLRFRLRSAPELSDSVVLSTARSDPRTARHLKGPDIDALGRLRQDAQRVGAQEPVLLDDGKVSDGATTALLWWRGNTLFTPPLALPRVDSVAARTVRGVAAALGAPVDEEAVSPAELEGCVVWAVNALHGIRAVTAWVNGPRLALDASRTTAWRARLSALARPL
ncbi:aminotransferase class IV [Leifsonia poae]|uniref:aminotransferase class IV n=1 Tax=Leifsonia poae TaxID=110933 RepID=UPI001CC11E7D|nr:aminotransferase class IV [Leifsonia poae]